MKISKIAAPAVAVGLVLTLIGCTGQVAPDDTQAPDDNQSSGDVTIRYLVEELEDAEAEARLRDRLDEFEAQNPGIVVDLQTLPFDTMRTILQTQLRSGDAPDVINWGSGPSFGGALADAGLLYDLTEAYEERGWEVYDFAKDRATTEAGVVYGIPGEMETLGVFYNRDLFEELGLEEPQSIADLEEIAEATKAAGYIPFAISNQEGWQGGHQLSMALSSAVGSAGVNDLVDGNSDWTSSDVEDAVALWDRFDEAGYLTPFPTSVSYDSGNALFFTGEAAMLPMGSWIVDGIVANADFEAGYFPFPAPDGQGIFAAGLGSGPMITAETQYPEEALKLIDFLVSPEHGRWMVENLDVIPPFPADLTGVEISPLLAQVLADVEQFGAGEGDFGLNIDVLMTDAFNEAMFDGMQAIYSDQATAAEVAASLEAASQQ
ncbi:carbohydrate ABC transporter substrate-binding protein (CUT1 family) [Microcella alkaliphila]|uniref:Carbohydrate ABC transporter substrate-binding protein (CUT1 family) n=1 Tax=Microcella alkaliphila TaxID=279828 RepID=A0A4Q7TJ99_9MICO|nr:extracellular solute-binding protein [Microcella alkaliphila]RZT60691.1 carbohydrate ABC transporter substrate-binding protein (CUT1 family) [Microcella alkaliphila]